MVPGRGACLPRSPREVRSVSSSSEEDSHLHSGTGQRERHINTYHHYIHMYIVHVLGCNQSFIGLLRCLGWVWLTVR